jgi:AraC-like DNA-binding protein
VNPGLRKQDNLSGRFGATRDAPQRLACFVGLGPVLAEHGVRLADVLDGTGVEPAVFDRDESRLPYGLLNAILLRAVAATGNPALGRVIGARYDHRVMGVAGLWMQNAPTLEAALTGFLELQSSNTRGATSYLHRQGEDVMFGYGVYDRTAHDYAQVQAMVIALAWNIVTGLTQGKCRPVEVLFAFREPPEPQGWRAHFGVPVRFGQPETGLVLRRSDLGLAITGANPVSFSALQERAAALMPPSAQVWSDRVRHVLRRLVIVGQGGVTETAARLEVHPRSLSRYLRDEGNTFRALSDETLSGVACELLAATDLRVGDIAEALGYASHAAFDAAFRRWSGVAPSDWRARHKVEVVGG